MLSLLGASGSFQFYSLRCILAIVCASTEMRLYSAISRTLNPRIGVFYLGIVVSGAGFFTASTALLPSTFAMYTSSLALTAFMDWHGGVKTNAGIMYFGIGALLGWPFAGALIIPFVVEDWILAVIGFDFWETFRSYLDGFVRCIIILGLQVGIDSFFYREFTVAPLNAVLYNVFSTADRGPDIFGTEPWHYYIRNLLLNFNLVFPLALAVGPLLLIQALFLRSRTTNQTLLRTITFVTPLYLWLVIFVVQPHKEERFMFPVYPFLALNAAIAFHILLSWLGNISSNAASARVPAQLSTFFVLLVVMTSTLLSTLRIVGITTAYSAPLKIYGPLLEPNATRPGDNVCLGKDWYRFPTSFFLPPTTRPGFVKSAFDGLLPGRFHEGQTGFGLFPGAWMIPSGMNDRNLEDPSKLTDLRHCAFLVDSRFPGTTATELEPDYIGSKEWKKVKCERFLDNTSTGVLGRSIWIPDLPVIPAKYRRVWGEHCLVRRKAGF